MATYPYAVRLDRKVKKTGALSGADTHFNMPFNDTTMLRAVLSSDHGASAGEEVTLVSHDANTVKAVDRDLTAGECIIGRPYTTSVELSRPYTRGRDTRGRDGSAILGGWLTIYEMIFSHDNTGQYSIRTTRANATTRTVSFSQSGNLATDAGELNVQHSGPSQEQTTFIESSTARPFTITGLKYEVDFQPQSGGG